MPDLTAFMMDETRQLLYKITNSLQAIRFTLFPDFNGKGVKVGREFNERRQLHNPGQIRMKGECFSAKFNTSLTVSVVGPTTFGGAKTITIRILRPIDR